MKRMLQFCTLLFLMLPLWKCTDIIEPDLSNTSIELIAPADSFSTNRQTVTFLWEESEDVLSYQLQVVQPNFTGPISIILDTTMATDRFVFTLTPGSYEWRVTGKNTNTSTRFQTFQLIVTEDSLLNNQLVNLVSPLDNTITNDSVITFLWQPLSAATSYRIRCANPDFSNSTFLEFDQLIPVDNYTHTFPDGTYRWQVRAENASSSSPYTEQGFTIDTQAPGAPVLTAPANAVTTTSPVDLSWTYAPDSEVDSVFVYSDSLMTLLESEAVLNVPYSFTTGMSGATYFWRVRSYDLAGNTSSFSSTRKFTLQ